MNETLKQLYERKSVRVFEQKEIPDEAKKAILQAAFMAPTAGCQQLYTIIDVTDPELKAALAESCDHQPFIAKAPAVLVFCADCKKWYDAFEAGGCEPRKVGVGDFMLAACDALIAAQNCVTAAESLGIGSCYIGDVMENYETQRELLGLPEKVFPVAMLVFGYPTEGQKTRQKPKRADADLIVHENRYREICGVDQERLFGAYAKGEDYEAWLRAFCNRKYNSDFSREMTRSVAAFLRTLE